MRVLVTGSSGFIGGFLARHFAEQGWDVAGLSRHTSSTLADLQQVTLDLGQPDLIERAMAALAPPDVIIHAAATRDYAPYETTISLTNAFGTHQLLALAARWQVRHVVYFSSLPVIGMPVVQPLTEEHPTAPLTAYHAAKLYGEHLTGIATAHGLPCAALRITAPVGPGMPDNRILSVFVRRAKEHAPLLLMGSGTRQQNYVDVRDIAQAVEQCIARQASGVFNIAGARAISNYDLARACIDVLRSQSRIEFTGQPDPQDGVVWDVSIAKAARAFGYSPQYDIRASIEAVAGL